MSVWITLLLKNGQLKHQRVQFLTLHHSVLLIILLFLVKIRLTAQSLVAQVHRNFGRIRCVHVFVPRRIILGGIIGQNVVLLLYVAAHDDGSQICRGHFGSQVHGRMLLGLLCYWRNLGQIERFEIYRMHLPLLLLPNILLLIHVLLLL